MLQSVLSTEVEYKLPRKSDMTPVGCCVTFLKVDWTPHIGERHSERHGAARAHLPSKRTCAHVPLLLAAAADDAHTCRCCLLLLLMTMTHACGGACAVLFIFGAANWF